MSCNLNNNLTAEVKNNVQALFNSDPSDDKMLFKMLINNTYPELADIIFSEFLDGENKISVQQTPMEIIQIDGRTRKIVNQNARSYTMLYAYEPVRLKEFENEFKKKIFAASIYDVNTNQFVRLQTDCNGITGINRNILNLKNQLLKTVIDFNGETFVQYDSVAEQQDYQNRVLNTFFNKIQSFEIDEDETYWKAFNSAVMLKYFDELLTNLTPFISIDPTYKRNSTYDPHRYVYSGPNVANFTGFSKNEFADMASQTSDIVTELLKILPLYNTENKVIPNSNISLSGFNSVMACLKIWAQSTSDEMVQKEWAKGASMDVAKLIDLYIDDLTNNDIKNPEAKTYLLNHLYGIKNTIYNKNMDESVRIMFTNTMVKTVRTSYVSYTWNKETKDLEIINLTERNVYNQKQNLRNTIEGAIKFWSNPNSTKTFNDFCNGLNIKINFLGNSIYEIKLNDKNVNCIIDNDTIKITEYDENITNEELANYLKVFAGIIVEDQFDDITNLIVEGSSAKSMYLPVLTNILLNVRQKQSNSNSNFSLDGKYETNLARVRSVISGSEIKNVTKNAEGNNLPIYQLTSLAYMHREIYNEVNRLMEKDLEVASVYTDNLIYQNIDNLKPTKIRSEITINDETVQASQMLDKDVKHIAIFYDFLKQMFSKTSSSDEDKGTQGIVGVQNHCFSDKRKHVIHQYDLNVKWSFPGMKNDINIFEHVSKYLKTGNETDIKKIVEAYYNLRKFKIDTTVKNIIKDYITAGVIEDKGSDEANINEIDKVLQSTKDLESIRAKFAASNSKIDFIEELHACQLKGDKKYHFNETVKYYYDITRDLNTFKTFLEDSYNNFLNDSKDLAETFSKDITAYSTLRNINEKLSKNFLTEDGELNDNFDGGHNPLLFAYFIVDNLLSNEANEFFIGPVYAHANKSKDKINDKDFNSKSLSSRWISQVKRMVIYGATYHSYAQGEKYGVPEEIDAAAIDDVYVSDFNMVGMQASQESMNGSGYTNPYFSRMQNKSLEEAAVGRNKKTIYHGFDSKYGIPKLLKWAEYEITNALRRTSVTIDMELQHKKMNSKPIPDTISKTIKYDKNFDNLYYRDYITKKFYKIQNIKISNGIIEVDAKECERDGKLKKYDNSPNTQIPLKCIYDIDRAFGGAWAMELDPETNQLQYTENNQDEVYKIICKNDLKNHLIGWLINPSGMKNGVTNLNPKSAWTSKDNTELRTFKMQTKFGGLQMDADHDLEDADISEPTQLMSALEQNGYTHDIAKKVYEEVGKYSYDSLSDIHNAIQSENKSELYQIFGKALIEAMSSGSKDTLGMAQTFIQLAKDSMNKYKINYQIPFSSPSINGLFNSTVTTTIIKNAIRRHLPGIACVLNPAKNVMQYFEINGKRYLKEQLLDKVEALAKEKNIILDPRWDIDKLINTMQDPELGINPFIEADITPENPIDLEDTIVIFDNTGTPIKNVYIDTIEKLEYYRTVDTSNICRWTIRPKNLKGSDTNFIIKRQIIDVEGNPVLDENQLPAYTTQKVSMFESPYAVVLRYLIEGKPKASNLQQLKDEIIQKAKENAKTCGATEEEQQIFADRQWNIILNEITPYLVNGEWDTTKRPLIKRIMYKKIQNVLNALKGDLEVPIEGQLPPRPASGRYIDTQIQNTILWGNERLEFIPESVTVTAAQVIMGKAYAKQLGLLKGDSIAEILENKEKFFENRIAPKYNQLMNKEDSHLYDWVLYDGHGNQIFVKLDNGTEIPRSGLDITYMNIDNTIYKEGKEICSADGKTFKEYIDDNGVIRTIVLIDDIKQLNDFKGTSICKYIHRNYREDNYEMLAKEAFGDNWNTISLTRDKKTILDFVNVKEKVRALNKNQKFHFQIMINKMAKKHFESFEKSLHCVGTRIPCQNMTSFAPMEVIAWTDSETNEIYVPTNIFYLQGSDLDIDKQYILGYEITKAGEYFAGDDVPEYRAETVLKNNIVEGIWQTVTDPRNQINLCMPVTTEHVKAIAADSPLGKAAEKMSPFNPACKFDMQEQNKVGQTDIGAVATSGKSFFALSYDYNEAYRNIAEALENNLQTGIFDETNFLLDQVCWEREWEQDGYKGKWVSLANVNMNMFMKYLVYDDNNKLTFDLNIPKDIREKLIDLWNFQYVLEDQSLMIGELLNSSTDNAKELDLKKLNADPNWIDLYTVACLLGIDFERVAKILSGIKDPSITKILTNYNKTIFTANPLEKNYDKVKYLQDNLVFTTLSDSDKNLLIYLAESAEEMRMLGKQLKINQGMPTKFQEFNEYVKSIEKFFHKRLKSKHDGNWKFNLMQFLEDSRYRQEMINEYEEQKTNFNILKTIRVVPHFREMFSCLLTNKQILNSLSKINEFRDLVYERLRASKIHYDESGTPSKVMKKDPFARISNAERIQAELSIEEHLINSWLSSMQLKLRWPANFENRIVASDEVVLDSLSVNTFRKLFETYIIPELRKNNKLANNKFIHNLTFGLDSNNKNEMIWKLPFPLGDSEKTAQNNKLYGDFLNGLNDLKNIKFPNINPNLTFVDYLYLYNLIVHHDKINKDSFTKIFEQMMSQDGKEDLLIFKYNTWLEQFNPKELINTFVPKACCFVKLPVTNHYTLLDENLNFSTIDENDVSENEDEYQLKSIPIVKENPTFYDAKVKTYYEQNQNDMLVDENDFYQIASIADQFIIVKGQPENDFIKLDKNFILFISKNSELGKSIINQNVGDSFTYNDSNYKITSKPKLFSETLCWDNSEKNTNFVESYYNTVPSGKSKLLETIKTMESPYIYVVTNLDLENEEPTIRNAKAFIKNGEIYINVDKATDATVVHEFGHLYLAQAKLERGKDYYNLLSQLDGTETYKELSKNSDYTTYKKASDFNEEVLAHMLEHYFNNELDEDSLDYKIVKEQLLPLLSDDFKKLMEGDTIVLPSEFITSNYAREQKVATVKQKLMKLNTLKEDCN